MHADAPEFRIRPLADASEYPELVAIWRSAVLATHDFLENSDFERIERHLIPDSFPAVSILVADTGTGLVGFAGSAEGSLEMLFVADSARGAGIGTALLDAAIAQHGVTKVDVNEQNTGALSFYLSRGCRQVGRSEVDGDGRPYPTLHLALPGGPGSPSAAMDGVAPMHIAERYQLLCSPSAGYCCGDGHLTRNPCADRR